MNSRESSPSPFSTQTVYSWRNSEMTDIPPEVTLSAWRSSRWNKTMIGLSAACEDLKRQIFETERRQAKLTPSFFKALDLVAWYLVPSEVRQKRCVVQAGGWLMLDRGGGVVHWALRSLSTRQNQEHSLQIWAVLRPHTSNNNTGSIRRWTLISLSSTWEKWIKRTEKSRGPGLREWKPALEAQEEKGEGNDSALLHSPAHQLPLPRKADIGYDQSPGRPHRSHFGIPFDLVLYEEETYLRDISIKIRAPKKLPLVKKQNKTKSPQTGSPSKASVFSLILKNRHITESSFIHWASSDLYVEGLSYWWLCVKAQLYSPPLLLLIIFHSFFFPSSPWNPLKQQYF